MLFDRSACLERGAGHHSEAVRGRTVLLKVTSAPQAHGIEGAVDAALRGHDETPVWAETKTFFFFLERSVPSHR